MKPGRPRQYRVDIAENELIVSQAPSHASKSAVAPTAALNASVSAVEIGRRQDRETAFWKTGTPSFVSDYGRDEYGAWFEFEVQAPSGEGVVKQRMRWIPGGTFLMGSPPDEAERGDNETQHEVTLTQGFWLADTACAQE
jgi:formylglycine-generating enzyme required for sulfatase activity